MKIKGNAHGMSFRRAKTQPIGRIPPFSTVRMKIMIFKTQPHPMVQFETQAGECLVGKNRVGIRAVSPSGAAIDFLDVNGWKGSTYSTPNVGNYPVSVGALKAEVEEKRHI